MYEQYVCVLHFKFLKEIERRKFYSSFYDIEKTSAIRVLYTTKSPDEKKKKKIKNKIK